MLVFYAKIRENLQSPALLWGRLFFGGNFDLPGIYGALRLPGFEGLTFGAVGISVVKLSFKI